MDSHDSTAPFRRLIPLKIDSLPLFTCTSAGPGNPPRASPPQGPATHADAAELLAAFTRAGGIAPTMAVQVGEQAARRGARASRAELVELFTRTATIAVAAAQDTDFDRLVGYLCLATISMRSSSAWPVLVNTCNGTVISPASGGSMPTTRSATDSSSSNRLSSRSSIGSISLCSYRSGSFPC
jgi:hypothetical protein